MTWLETNKGYIAGAFVLYSIIMQLFGFLSLIKACSNQDGYYAGKEPIYFSGAILRLIASMIVLNNDLAYQKE